MSKKMTTEEFIAKAKAIHGDMYDYSKTVYKGSFDDVTIICPTHGEFTIRASHHLDGGGCQECGYKRISEGRLLTREEFIAKARKKFGEKFDYSKVIYKGMGTEIIITCPKHGDFEITPKIFFNTRFGCRECYLENLRMTTEEFIEKARKVHGDKYDYSKTDLTKRDDKDNVIITCPKHGDFKQTPDTHLNGSGCRKCGIEERIRKRLKPLEQFIEEAKSIHKDKYDYSKVVYKGTNKKVTIICPKHGEFTLTPKHHLQGVGCPICNQSHLEEVVHRELENLGIEFEYNKFYPMLNNLQLDFYIPSQKIAIECQGEQHFKAIEYFGGEEAFKIRVERDLRKAALCKENGITLLYYSNLGIEYPYEVYEDKNLLVEKIKELSTL